jgi:hypothetical protein
MTPPGIYADEDGFLVEVLAEQGGDAVECSPQGGGLVQRVPRALFEKRFRLASQSKFRRVSVSGDWMGVVQALPAYADGRRWNGFTLPHFLLQDAVRICESFPGLRYDGEEDCFFFRNSDAPIADDPAGEPAPEERIDPVVLEVHGEHLRTYPIGAGSWCWFEVDD